MVKQELSRFLCKDAFADKNYGKTDGIQSDRQIGLQCQNGGGVCTAGKKKTSCTHINGKKQGSPDITAAILNIVDILKRKTELSMRNEAKMPYKKYQENQKKHIDYGQNAQNAVV